MAIFGHMKRVAFILWIFLLFSSGIKGQLVFDFYEVQKDGVGGVDGIDTPYGVAVSPDGKHVYAASSTDDAVTVFSKSGVGALTFVETHKDDAQVGGTIDGLNGAKRLAVAPDGNHLYIPSLTDDALVVFSRNSSTGALTYVETHKNGVSGVSGLDGAFEVSVSPDNNHVYVAGSADDMIAVFSRNTTTGALTFVEVQQDGIGGVDGLNGVRSVAVAPDGNHVYAASAVDDAIAVFSRNSSTGALTYVEMQQDGVGGVDGLNGAYGICISADNNHVYVVGSTDDAIAGFSRNTGTGGLTYLESHKDDSQGGTMNYLNVPRSVAISNDGNYVAVISSSDDALTIFSRTVASGLLTFKEEFKDGIGGVDGLDGGRNLVFGTDDYNIFVVSSTDNAVGVFTENSLLPASYVALKAKEKPSSGIEISWRSPDAASYSFSVEKSLDARSWQEISPPIHSIQLGDTTYYAAVDEVPQIGTSYYRLMTKDANGDQEFSAIVSVSQQQAMNVRITPNPVSRYLSIDWGGRLVWGKIEVVNLLGKQMLCHQSRSQASVTLDLAFLPRGLYFVNVYLDEMPAVYSIIKQ